LGGALSIRRAIWIVISSRSGLGAFAMTFPGTRDKDFQIARSVAIEAHANLEFVLSKLFAQLLHADDARAAIVFFRITNARSRNAIIEGLLEREHGEQYDIYWHGEPGDDKGKRKTRGLLALIRNLDDRRNEIVHWHVIRSYGITPSGFKKQAEELRSVGSWYKLPGQTQKITTESLTEFTAKCEFASGSIHKFVKFTTTEAIPIDPVERETWLQIFLQPVSYPPSDNHPLSPNYIGPGSPLRPSRG
jgi:hypothetical protein